jgi:hypothetical protein
VYLRANANQPAAPILQMKRELAALMSQAGYRLVYRRLDADTSLNGDSAFLAVVEMNGVCAPAPGHLLLETATVEGPLATTQVIDGHVLPFSAVNCASLNRLTAAALIADAPAQRDYLYGRALARVVAHELYHVLMRTMEHAHSGIAQSCFTTGDLLTERFDFESSVLARLRPRSDSISIAASADEATGRL